MSAALPIIALLLDDDEKWLQSLSLGLTARGNVHCVPFTIPEDALRALESVATNICVIDFSLGRGWTGARFALAVRAHLGVRTPPLLLVTEALGDVPPADLAHFDDAYPKDLDPRALIEALLDHAKGQ